MEKVYEAIVIGSGHAGCESALALARLGHNTLLMSLNLDNIAFLACNPSIGGTAKGQLASEVDALGGQMGINADKSLLQLRMLNSGKGPAVQSLRAQVDKEAYHLNMKRTLEQQPLLTILQDEAMEIIVEDNAVVGVKTALGNTYKARGIVVCSGVYLKSKIIIGEFQKESGPSGFAPARGLSESLVKLGHTIRRFKTGTPARVLGESIDYSKFEEQRGDDNIQTFSFVTKRQPKNTHSCYLGYTNALTHKIIRENIHRAPLYSGAIKGIGPRYCPSIEDKIMRFADKERHQLFLEPESASTDEIYVQGMSTSMPVDVQEQMYRSISGFENVQLMRNAYAIEYDCIDSLELYNTLGSRKVQGLYFAGQVNGTSGYEEAAAQGIIAGINCAMYLSNKPQLVLGRDQAYIGVLIDDLVTKGTNEPYRMMTSRAEYRLYLRQDNADIRLTEIGRTIGLVDDNRYKSYCQKLSKINKLMSTLDNVISPKNLGFLAKYGEKVISTGVTIRALLKRSNITAKILQEELGLFGKTNAKILEYITTEVKYEGYLSKQTDQIAKMKKSEEFALPTPYDYSSLKGLRIEAIQKLNKFQPTTLGQASRISGVSPADIQLLTVYFFKKNRK